MMRSGGCQLIMNMMSSADLLLCKSLQLGEDNSFLSCACSMEKEVINVLKSQEACTLVFLMIQTRAVNYLNWVGFALVVDNNQF